MHSIETVETANLELMSEEEKPTPVKAQKVSERVAGLILDQISNGDLTPGERLPGERQLAESLGVSRVSVRAALQKLKAQGFLEAVQGGGTRVISSAGDMDSPLTALLQTNSGNLHDLAEIRGGLEVWAARKAALNATEEDVKRLEAVIAAMEKARGTDKAVEDINFHYALARATGSVVYVHIFDVIRDTLTSTLEYHQYRPVREFIDDQVLIEQHRSVLEAIKTRNPNDAAKAMSAHLESVLKRYEAEKLRQGEAEDGAAE